jgi:serine/threonine protein kinase
VKEIGRQILSALTYLNDMGIIHQDLKPANIMFDKE